MPNQSEANRVWLACEMTGVRPSAPEHFRDASSMAVLMGGKVSQESIYGTPTKIDFDDESFWAIGRAPDGAKTWEIVE